MIFPVLNLRNYNRGEVKFFNDNDEETGESLSWDHWVEVGVGPRKAIDAGSYAATPTHPPGSTPRSTGHPQLIKIIFE